MWKIFINWNRNNGGFINIKDEDEKYYHIYFNNKKEEIKRDYIDEDDKVSKINILIDYQIISLHDLFCFCQYIESMYFKKFYRNNINNMNNIFCGCSSLKEINLPNFNTNNVTNMSRMFYKCSSMKELKFSNFNTSNITNMRAMFCDVQKK